MEEGKKSCFEPCNANMHVKNLWYCENFGMRTFPLCLKKSPCLMPTWTTHLCLAAGLSPLFFSSVLRVLVYRVVVLRRRENHMIIMSSRFYSQPLRRSHLQGASQLICNQGRFPGLSKGTILKWGPPHQNNWCDRYMQGGTDPLECSFIRCFPLFRFLVRRGSFRLF